MKSKIEFERDHEEFQHIGIQQFFFEMTVTSFLICVQQLGVGLVIPGWWKLKVRAYVEMLTKFCSAMIFISILGLMDFSYM